jgi:hypothetical protein
VLTEVESCYSQAKLELYSLFRALHAVHVFIFSMKNLTVDIDAKYIMGMINNPDLQPNATMNRWIVLKTMARWVHTISQRGEYD